MKNLKTLCKKVGLAVTPALLLAATTAEAGTWTFVENSDLATPLDQSFGTLIEATNLGDGTQSAVTLQGIPFATETSNVTGNPGDHTTYSGADADLSGLLNTTLVVSEWGSGIRINLDGLNVGSEYQFQMVLAGQWNWCQANLHINDWQDSQWVRFFDDSTEYVATYTFTAASSSIAVNLASQSGYGNVYLSAYALHGEVVDPVDPVDPSDPTVYSLKKGVGGTRRMQVESLNPSWYYNWGMVPTTGVDPSIEYVPMRHNRWWPAWEKLAQSGDFDYILGYNEPESANQGNISVDQAIAQWPNMETARTQYSALVGSPATVNPMVPWIVEFMNKIDENGYNVDFMTMHSYPGPNSSGSIINGAQRIYDAYGMDVWITEFNAADWSPPVNHTHADSYTWLVEVLYRLETTDFIKRYAIFPWDDTWSAAEGSAIYETDSDSELTPLGRLYAEYRSSDVNGPYADVWYHVHSQRAQGHINNGLSAASANLYSEAYDVDFRLIPTGTAGEWYLLNRANDQVLASDGTLLFWLNEPVASAKWRLGDADYCWKYIEHVASGMRLKSTTSGQLSMAEASSTGQNVRWTFVRSANTSESSGYAHWAALYGVTGAQSDDHDGNGLKNILQYAIEEAPVLLREGGRFHYSFKKRTDDPNLTVFLEQTDDLSSNSWSDVTGEAQTTPQSNAFADVLHTFSATGDRVYLRVRTEYFHSGN